MNLSIKKHKEVLAWSMYDFANQPFTTLIVTFIFSAFFTESLAENNEQGTYLWSLGISITALIVAFTSPILGALADSGGYRKIILMLSLNEILNKSSISELYSVFLCFFL